MPDDGDSYDPDPERVRRSANERRNERTGIVDFEDGDAYVDPDPGIAETVAIAVADLRIHRQV
ncbi:hypothetical protein [Halosimplex salinum]|uniref:hypothetical protein n=1 Tax=Halosimplex salinum TaxID=1710538 RepID=UPI000F474AB0|nr:hypothetical protein [Halosimplex salinum]